MDPAKGGVDSIDSKWYKLYYQGRSKKAIFDNRNRPNVAIRKSNMECYFEEVISAS